jgi:hypothetical protein
LHLFNEDIEVKQEGANPSCQCLPGCHELTYSSDTSSSTLVDTFPGNEKYVTRGEREKIDNITYFKYTTQQI